MTMALLFRRVFLETASPFAQFKRFRGKINVQKPKPPHFEKATYLALANPWFINPKKGKTSVEMCKFNEPLDKKEAEPNYYNQIVARELYAWLSTSKLVIFYHHNSIKADEHFKYFSMFKKQKMYLRRYGRKILEMSVKGTPYEAILDLYVTTNNLILFCSEPEIGKALKITKKCPQLVLLAGIFENKLLSKDELDRYGKIPNIQAAQSELVHTISGVGSQLVNDLNYHQNNLVSNCLDLRIKQLQEEK